MLSQELHLAQYKLFGGAGGIIRNKGGKIFGRRKCVKYVTLKSLETAVYLVKGQKKNFPPKSGAVEIIYTEIIFAKCINQTYSINSFVKCFCTKIWVCIFFFKLTEVEDLFFLDKEIQKLLYMLIIFWDLNFILILAERVHHIQDTNCVWNFW